MSSQSQVNTTIEEGEILESVESSQCREINSNSLKVPRKKKKSLHSKKQAESNDPLLVSVVNKHLNKSGRTHKSRIMPKSRSDKSDREHDKYGSLSKMEEFRKCVFPKKDRNSRKVRQERRAERTRTMSQEKENSKHSGDTHHHHHYRAKRRHSYSRKKAEKRRNRSRNRSSDDDEEEDGEGESSDHSSNDERRIGKRRHRSSESIDHFDSRHRSRSCDRHLHKWKKRSKETRLALATDDSRLKDNVLMRKLLQSENPSGSSHSKQAPQQPDNNSDLSCEIGSVSTVSSLDCAFLQRCSPTPIESIELISPAANETKQYSDDSEIEVIIPHKSPPPLIELESDSEAEQHSVSFEETFGAFVATQPQVIQIQDEAEEEERKDDDEDLDDLQLRLAALRSAVLKKHRERVERFGLKKKMAALENNKEEEDGDKEREEDVDSYHPSNRTSPMSPTSSYNFSPTQECHIEQDIDIDDSDENNEQPIVENYEGSNNACFPNNFNAVLPAQPLPPGVDASSLPPEFTHSVYCAPPPQYHPHAPPPAYFGPGHPPPFGGPGAPPQPVPPPAHLLRPQFEPMPHAHMDNNFLPVQPPNEAMPHMGSNNFVPAQSSNELGPHMGSNFVPAQSSNELGPHLGSNFVPAQASNELGPHMGSNFVPAQSPNELGPRMGGSSFVSAPTPNEAVPHMGSSFVPIQPSNPHMVSSYPPVLPSHQQMSSSFVPGQPPNMLPAFVPSQPPMQRMESSFVPAQAPNNPQIMGPLHSPNVPSPHMVSNFGPPNQPTHMVHQSSFVPTAMTTNSLPTADPFVSRKMDSCGLVPVSSVNCTSTCNRQLEQCLSSDNKVINSAKVIYSSNSSRQLEPCVLATANLDNSSVLDKPSQQSSAGRQLEQCFPQSSTNQEYIPTPNKQSSDYFPITKTIYSSSRELEKTCSGLQSSSQQEYIPTISIPSSTPLAVHWSTSTKKSNKTNSTPLAFNWCPSTKKSNKIQPTSRQLETCESSTVSAHQEEYIPTSPSSTNVKYIPTSANSQGSVFNITRTIYSTSKQVDACEPVSARLITYMPTQYSRKMNAQQDCRNRFEKDCESSQGSMGRQQGLEAESRVVEINVTRYEPEQDDIDDENEELLRAKLLTSLSRKKQLERLQIDTGDESSRSSSKEASQDMLSNKTVSKNDNMNINREVTQEEMLVELNCNDSSIQDEFMNGEWSKNTKLVEFIDKNRAKSNPDLIDERSSGSIHKFIIDDNSTRSDSMDLIDDNDDDNNPSFTIDYNRSVSSATLKTKPFVGRKPVKKVVENLAPPPQSRIVSSAKVGSRAFSKAVAKKRTATAARQSKPSLEETTKFIIRLGSSEEESNCEEEEPGKAWRRKVMLAADEEKESKSVSPVTVASPAPVLEKRIDELLQAVRRQHEPLKVAISKTTNSKTSRLSPTAMGASKKSAPIRSGTPTAAGSKTISTSTPAAVKHLPKSAQEEYRRLKQAMLEKEKQNRLEAARKRLLLKQQVAATSSSTTPPATATSCATTMPTTATATSDTTNLSATESESARAIGEEKPCQSGTTSAIGDKKRCEIGTISANSEEKRGQSGTSSAIVEDRQSGTISAIVGENRQSMATSAIVGENSQSGTIRTIGEENYESGTIGATNGENRESVTTNSSSNEKRQSLPTIASSGKKRCQSVPTDAVSGNKRLRLETVETMLEKEVESRLEAARKRMLLFSQNIVTTSCSPLPAAATSDANLPQIADAANLVTEFDLAVGEQTKTSGLDGEKSSSNSKIIEIDEDKSIQSSLTSEIDGDRSCQSLKTSEDKSCHDSESYSSAPSSVNEIETISSSVIEKFVAASTTLEGEKSCGFTSISSSVAEKTSSTIEGEKISGSTSISCLVTENIVATPPALEGERNSGSNEMGVETSNDNLASSLPIAGESCSNAVLGAENSCSVAQSPTMIGEKSCSTAPTPVIEGEKSVLNKSCSTVVCKEKSDGIARKSDPISPRVTKMISCTSVAPSSEVNSEKTTQEHVTSAEKRCETSPSTVTRSREASETAVSGATSCKVTPSTVSPDETRCNVTPASVSHAETSCNVTTATVSSDAIICNVTPSTVSPDETSCYVTPATVSRDGTICNVTSATVSRDGTSCNVTLATVSRDETSCNVTPATVSRDGTSCNVTPATVSRDETSCNVTLATVSHDEKCSKAQAKTATSAETSYTILQSLQLNSCSSETTDGSLEIPRPLTSNLTLNTSLLAETEQKLISERYTTLDKLAELSCEAATVVACRRRVERLQRLLAAECGELSRAVARAEVCARYARRGRAECQRLERRCRQLADGDRYRLPTAGEELLKARSESAMMKADAALREQQGQQHNEIQDGGISFRDSDDNLDPPADLEKDNEREEIVVEGGEVGSERKENNEEEEGRMEEEEEKMNVDEDVKSSRSKSFKCLPDYVSPLNYLQNSANASTRVESIFCPYDLMGSCRDETCPYQHSA